MGRKKNATRNLIYGEIEKIYYIVIPFVRRTLMLYFLGVEYLGLSGLFTSILQVLNLAELGVGDAMVYSMYKPFAENDRKTLCELLQLYKIYYRVIGAIILVFGLFLAPFVPHLIHGQVPEDVSIYVLYLLNLCSVVITYWMFAYKRSVLFVAQRSDVISKLTLVIRTIFFIIQFLAICVFRNYYLYLIAGILFQAASNLGIAFAARRLYPDIAAKGELAATEKKEITHRIGDLFTAKVGGVIVNSADSIIISAFLGLISLALYQNYYYVILAAGGIMGIFFQACTAGIGNSLVTESEHKNFHDFELMTFITLWLTGVCISCMLSLYQPFMTIWVGEEMLLEDGIVICFCIYFGVLQLNSLFSTYKDAAGIWHADRFRPLITAGVNFLMNILTVRHWGLYGVILSTVVSTMGIGIPWIIRNLFDTVFERKYLRRYFRKLMMETAGIFIGCMVCTMVCNIFTGNPYFVVAVRLCICLGLTNLLFYVFFRKDSDFREIKVMIAKMLKSKGGI